MSEEECKVRYCEVLDITSLPRTQEELDAALKAVQNADPDALANLAPKPPTVPNMSAQGGSIAHRLRKLQAMINSFQYNFTGRKFLDLKKTEGMYRVSRTAKEIIAQSLPIKCVEACFLGAYLTVGVSGLTRVPVAFKSRVMSSTGNRTFQHIVLAVATTPKSEQSSKHETSNTKSPISQNMVWGSIGLSRSKNLMDKELKYSSLASLLEQFKDAYEEEGHKLVNIYVGLPFGQNEYSQVPILWRVLRLKLDSFDWSEISRVLDIYTAKMHSHLEAYLSTQCLPDSFRELYEGHLEPNMESVMAPASPKKNARPSIPKQRQAKAKKSPSGLKGKEKTNINGKKPKDAVLGKKKKKKKVKRKGKGKQKAEKVEKEESCLTNGASEFAEARGDMKENENIRPAEKEDVVASPLAAYKLVHNVDDQVDAISESNVRSKTESSESDSESKSETESDTSDDECKDSTDNGTETQAKEM